MHSHLLQCWRVLQVWQHHLPQHALSRLLRCRALRLFRAQVHAPHVVVIIQEGLEQAAHLRSARGVLERRSAAVCPCLMGSTTTELLSLAGAKLHKQTHSLAKVTFDC